MRYDPITFPDAAAVVIGYLVEHLPDYGYPDVPVFETTPNPRPPVFVVITRGGGPLRDIVTDEAQINTESWSTHRNAAGRLAETVRALIRAMRATTIGEVGCHTVREFAGPRPLPDPENSGHARYVQTFAVALSGAVLSPGD